MLNKSLIQLLSAVLLVGFLSACGEGEDRQEKYLERAQANFKEGNFEKARVEARNVLQINPKNVPARQLLGEISFKDGDIRKAYGAFLSVVDADPENIGALTHLAQIFLAVKDNEKTVEYTNRVLAIEPDNAQVMGYKALALVAQGDIAAAEALSREALAIDAGIVEAVGVLVQKHYKEEQPELGLALLDAAQKVSPKETRLNSMKISLLETMGRKDAVEDELVKLTNEYPEERRYATTLAKYYIRESRLENAEAVLRGHAERNEDNVEAKLALVSFMLQHNSKEAAVAQVQQYIDAEPDQSQLLLALAELHLFTGDYDSAISVLESAVDSNPRSVGSIEARNLLVGIFLQQEKAAPAEKLLDEIFEIEPENPVALLTRSRLALSQEKNKDAIADLRVILKNDPENVMALKLLAAAQEREGSEGLALDNYKKLMILEQPDLGVLASAARLAIQSEQYQEAENYIRQALELDANNAGLVTNLIRLLVLKEDWEAAKSFAQRLIDKEDSEALGYFLKAGLDARMDGKGEAIKSLKRSLEIEPKAVESLASLATMLAEEESVESAIDYVGNHCDTYNEQAHCRHLLGSLYAQNKAYDKAEESLKAALSLNDKQVTSYRQLAKVYAAQRKTDDIVATLKQGLEATDDQSMAFELANFYYQIQDYQKSSEVYKAMINANADSLPAKNNLAMLYAEFMNTPENLKEAAALIADLQDSDNPAYLDTVGWVLYLTGEYDRAVTYLQAAVDKVGSSGLLQYHLGMAFYKLGDLENAKIHLELAIENKEARYAGFDLAEATLAELQ